MLTDQEATEFEEKEIDHQMAFANYNRISYFAHSLHLLVAQFDKVGPFQKVLMKAIKLVAKFNKSVKATELLMKYQENKLNIRLSNKLHLSFILQRLLESKENVLKVTEGLEWNSLQVSAWMEKIKHHF